MNERKISIIYKALVIISLLTGIMLNIMNTTSILSILSYYTLQSNIICLIAFTICIIMDIAKKEYRKTSEYYLVKGGIIIAILITGIVYQIALAPNNFNMSVSQQNREISKELANVFVHEISPILVLIDYFLFDIKGKFKIYYPIIWLAIPLNYVIYVYSYSARGGQFYGIGGSRNYAYFFLDYEQIGYIGVGKWIICIIIFILMLSYILIIIDKILNRLKKENNKGPF